MKKILTVGESLIDFIGKSHLLFQKKIRKIKYQLLYT